MMLKAFFNTNQQVNPCKPDNDCRQEEKARLEAGRQREQEMLMRLATKEERMRIAEDERRRKEEEEERAMMEEEVGVNRI